MSTATATAWWTSTRRLRSSAGSYRRWPLLRYPFMTARVTAGIYLEALRLWLKRAPYHPRPT